jgi:hypothetical protein
VEAVRPRAAIFDIDGTLSDASARVHLITGSAKDWDGFVARAGEDKPYRWCVDVLKGLVAVGYVPVFLTSRPEDQLDVTLRWIEEHPGQWATNGVNLFMRSVGDRRHDDVFKRECYQTLIAPRYDVALAIDDRTGVCRMWRDLGIVALQCGDWEERHGHLVFGQQ